MHKPLLEVLNGKRQAVPPVWMMRQAGRYLPEYMAVRENVGGVLDLCFTPKLAADVTLQPIRRFGFDAAILFSDILVVPHALGRSVRFEAGEGPRLEPLDDPAAMAALRSTIDDAVLAPIYETIRLRQSRTAAGRDVSRLLRRRPGRLRPTWSPATARRIRRRRGCSPIGIPRRSRA